MDKKFAVLLVRVSTEMQDYDAQILDLESFARKRGFNTFKTIETKESGLISIDQRTGTNELFNFIEENPDYQTVFATEISRLARRQSTLHLIKDWLVKNKIQLFLKDSDFKLLNEDNKISAEAEMMFSLFGIFAESEIKQKKLRFARERRKLMAMGLSISGKTLFGYERKQIDSGQNTLVHHKENADIVRKIYNWYLHGFEGIKDVSISKINLQCIKEDLPKYTHSKRNINKLLKEEAYTGFKITNNKWKNPLYDFGGSEEKYLYSKNEIFYGVPIIDRETFDAVQLKLKEKNNNVDKSTKHITLLAKLITCPVCGKFFQGDYRIKEKTIKHTYRCSSRSTPLKCTNSQTFSMAMLDAAVWNLIKTDLPLLAKQIVENDPKDDAIKQQKMIENLESKEKAIRENIKKENLRYEIFIKNPESVESDFFDKYETKIENYNKSIKKIVNERAKIKIAQSIKEDQLGDIDFVINSNLQNIENSKELLKKYINIFVENINVLLHNKRFSVFSINFKLNSSGRLVLNNNKTNINNNSAEYIESPFNKTTFLILDKIQTLKIRAFKTNQPISIINEDTIKVHHFVLPLVKLSETFTGIDKNKGILKEFHEFEFNKINIY